MLASPGISRQIPRFCMTDEHATKLDLNHRHHSLITKEDPECCPITLQRNRLWRKKVKAVSVPIDYTSQDNQKICPNICLKGRAVGYHWHNQNESNHVRRACKDTTWMYQKCSPKPTAVYNLQGNSRLPHQNEEKKKFYVKEYPNSHLVLHRNALVEKMRHSNPWQDSMTMAKPLQAVRNVNLGRVLLDIETPVQKKDEDFIEEIREILSKKCKEDLYIRDRANKVYSSHPGKYYISSCLHRCSRSKLQHILQPELKNPPPTTHLSDEKAITGVETKNSTCESEYFPLQPSNSYEYVIDVKNLKDLSSQLNVQPTFKPLLAPQSSEHLVSAVDENTCIDRLENKQRGARKLLKQRAATKLFLPAKVKKQQPGTTKAESVGVPYSECKSSVAKQRQLRVSFNKQLYSKSASTLSPNRRGNMKPHSDGISFQLTQQLDYGGMAAEVEPSIQIEPKPFISTSAHNTRRLDKEVRILKWLDEVKVTTQVRKRMSNHQIRR